MNLNKCILHPKEEYKFICFENHSCQIKFCAECFSEHRPSRYETINKFLVQISEIFSTLEENQKIDDNFKEIKKNLEKVERLYLTILKTVDKLIQDLKSSNSNYFIIKQKLNEKNIESFTNTELKTLTESGLTSQIGTLNIFQQTCGDKIFHIVQESAHQLKQLKTSILQKILKNEIAETQELFSVILDGKKIKNGKISLIGEKILNIMHGKYYYQIENNEKVLKKGGKYFLDHKIGKWSELNQKYKNSLSSVLLEGEYYNGKKVGKWKQKYNGLSFECNYNNVGQKEGKCQDSFIFVQNNGCITKKGSYNSGVKIKGWEIYYLNKINDIQKIGGGKYDEYGQKIGNWIDINESEFCNYNQVVWQGEYHAGVKVGEWKMSFRKDDQSDFKQIGGGKYDQFGLKIGNWIDVNRSEFDGFKQFIQQGEYHAGVKVGQWRISYRQNDESKFSFFLWLQLWFSSVRVKTYQQGSPLKNSILLQPSIQNLLVFPW